MKKFSRHTAELFGLLLVLCAVLLFNLVLNANRSPSMEYSQIKELFTQEKVRSFTTKDGVLTMILRSEDGSDPQTITYQLPSFAVFYEDMNDLVEEQYAKGILQSYDYQPNSEEPWILTILPYLLMLLLFGAFLFVFLRRTGAGGGGNGPGKFIKANVRSGNNQQIVTFQDVAGAEEEKEELREIVDFLGNPEKYTRMGAKIPKGVLLVGPPGTGKTLLARAVAGEANVDFLTISGSDFVELYVGVGASRVRDLFEQAKKLAPAIVFIDEIDAVGRRRGAGLGGGNDEREQTLNQLLVEMDGFSKNDGVIIMAATNRADVLDPALLRPGRFDRQIYVGAPDTDERKAILQIHAKNKPLAESVDLTTIARSTEGFTGADLSNLMNEAALLAARNNQPVITMPVMEEAIMKVLAGPEKKSRKVTAYDRHITAIHEAGHAVAIYYLPTHDPVHRITIVPRGQAAGLTISLPTTDNHHMSKRQMEETIIGLLGGRVAEQICLSDISTGASNDLERASAIARDMVSKYGMSSKIGPVSYGSDGEVFIGRDYEKTKTYSERTAGELDDEVKVLVEQSYHTCEELLTKHRHQVECIAAFLEQHDTMDRTQFEAAMKGQDIPESMGSLFDAFRDTNSESL